MNRTEAAVARIAEGDPITAETVARLVRRLDHVGGRVVGAHGDLPERLAQMGDANPAPVFTTNAPLPAFRPWPSWARGGRRPGDWSWPTTSARTWRGRAWWW